MARKTNPGTLRVGPGSSASKSSDPLVLLGAGLTSTTSIGQVGNIPPGGSLGSARAGTSPDSAEQSLQDHVQDPLNAHDAQAIAYSSTSTILASANVEEALNALTGAVTAEPPFLGQWKRSMTFSSIPDWGSLKLADGDLKSRSLLTSPNSPTEIYPYYYVPPSPARDPEFTIQGNDPWTDALWNTAVFGLDGAGQGSTYAGAITREGLNPNEPVMRTVRIMPRLEDGGVAYRNPVVVSGSFYPADKGVVALLHWPADGAMADFLAQPLLDRCIAALLCGQGIMGDRCFHYNEESTPGDGDSGGIFAVGRNADGAYDPFAFPGRASGQYDLREIVEGTSELDGTPLAAPWNDWDQDGVAGAKRFVNTYVPGPGQVRLGTVPEANNGLNAAPVQPYGIPVLGGPANLYSPVPATTYLGYGAATYRVLQGVAGVFNSIIWDSGEDRNFFGYRLPVLKDYSSTTGMKHTPRGVDALSTKETFRFFEPKSPNSGLGLVNGYLATAGNYPAFDEDFWPWQIGRFRHAFLLPSTEALGAREEAGSYFLIHFKRERDFEAFVRDGIAPNDPTDGYSIYGSYFVDAVPSSPETDSNLANAITSTSAFAPLGPAPDYGYSSKPYHSLRSTVILDPVWSASPGSTPSGITSATGLWVSQSTSLDPHVMWVSGVRYLVPRKTDDGTASFLADFTIDGSNFWYSYRTSDNPLTGQPGAPPAVISSPNPLFVGVAPFSYESEFGTPTFDPNTATDPDCVRVQRVEFPYTYMGTNAGGAFSETNGPMVADTIAVTASGIEFFGDPSYPSFSTNARLRAFTRRPLAHRNTEGAALPYSATDGHGVPITWASPASLLFHSTRFSVAGTRGAYANFRDPLSSNGTMGYSEFFIPIKDVAERFLDETYRYRGDFTLGAPGVTAAQAAHLNGPGMAGWVGGFISTPVRIGASSLAGWETLSWLQAGEHESNLNAVTPPALQVAGLPDRNPPLSNGVIYPFPSSGLLLYPQTDYSTGYRPSLADADIPSVQPDYSGLPTAGGERTYIRAFDADFSHTLITANAAGQPFLTLRIEGLTLADFAYSAPGPGGLPTTGIAIMLKVPGLTTWMDVGRRDGAGPSKQDAILDGAGCQVVGPETFDTTDGQTGIVYSEVKINVGPFANLTEVIDPAFPDQLGEVPVLVKVIMSEAAADYTFDRQATAPGTFAAYAGPGVSTSLVRGLIGIRVVYTTP